MRIIIDLPLIKLQGVEYSDEHFRYNGYKLSTFNGSLAEMSKQFEIAQELFFQDEMSINKDFLEQVKLDTETVTYELANLLFGNLEKAVGLQKYTGVRFDQINVEFEGQGGARYEVDDINYDVMYEDEAIAEAREFDRDYAIDMGLSELIGDAKYIDDYFDIINPEKLLTTLKDFSESQKIEMKGIPDDTKKAISWLIKKIDDDDAIFEIIEDKELFDYDYYAETNVTDINYAIDVLNPYVGDMVYSGKTVLDGWRPQTVYVFERS